MSSDNQENQIDQVQEERNSDEGQYECITEDIKDDNNSASSNNVVSNASSEESQNDKEIVEAKSDNCSQNDLQKNNVKENIKQGFRIINNVNSSASESPDQSSEEESKVTFTEKIKNPVASELKTKIIEFIRKVQQNPKVQQDMPEYIQDNIYEFEHVFQEIFQENQTVQRLNGEAIEVVIIKPLHDMQQITSIMFNNITSSFQKVKWDKYQVSKISQATQQVFKYNKT